MTGTGSMKKTQGGGCADPGIFARGGGGGGGSGQYDKKSSANVYFFSPQLILLKSNG